MSSAPQGGELAAWISGLATPTGTPVAIATPAFLGTMYQSTSAGSPTARWFFELDANGKIVSAKPSTEAA